MVIFDDLHWNPREVDGYNKPLNFIISPREPGKTTAMWYLKIFGNWRKTKKPWLYLVRYANEINDQLIDDIQEVNINKFLPDDKHIKLEYARGSLESGQLDIKIGGEIFVRILALNIPIRRIKLSLLRNIGGVYMDEYIIDPTSGEKYLKGEGMKLKEIYTTYRRESDGIMKMYFTANPYSLYNPVFLWWNVPTNELKEGAVIVGEQYVVQCYKMKEELREKILRDNPLFKFDDSYKKYAFDGSAVNDQHIKKGNLPQNYRVKFVIRYNSRLIGIYQNNYYQDHEDRYFVRFIDDTSAKRTIYCFEFEDLINGCALIGNQERAIFNHFKIAMRKRAVSFEDINVYYFTEELYKFL